MKLFALHEVLCSPWSSFNQIHYNAIAYGAYNYAGLIMY